MSKPISEATSFDISSLLYENTATFAVKDPAGRPTTWMVTIAGPSHPVSAEISRKVTARRDKHERDKIYAERRKQVFQADPEEENEFWQGVFASRVIDWTPVKIGGEDFPPTAENKLRIFAEPRFSFVSQQIMDEANVLENFMPKTAKA
ncbi:MAG: hypothetical protein ACOVMT_01350 [Caulobacter sp.]